MTIPSELQFVVDATLLVGLFAMLVMNWRIQGDVRRVLDAVSGSSIAERWAAAVAFLGRSGDGTTSTVEIRLGGIYAVEQIARESQAYRAPTMELLATYVRQHAPLGRTGIEPDVEIQSILTVLARSGVEGLDLRRTALSGADLEIASLIGVDLSEARIGGARFAGMKLSRARMRDAILTDADLSGADLSGASLAGARLSGADLTGADLRGADLKGVDLRRARLRGADLRETSLSGATLNEAVLDGADLSGVSLNDVDLEAASLKGATMARADLQRANLNRADFSAADLRCSWHGARLVGAILPDDMPRRPPERASNER